MSKLKVLRLLIALILSAMIVIFIKNPINWLLGAIGICVLSIFTDLFIPSMRVLEDYKKENFYTFVFMIVLLVLFFAFR